jgi:hypothetical protein
MVSLNCCYALVEYTLASRCTVAIVVDRSESALTLSVINLARVVQGVKICPGLAVNK